MAGRPPAARLHSPPAGPEDVRGSLLAMGFREAGVRQLLRLQPDAGPRLLDVLAELLLLGLRPEPVCAAVRRRPCLLELPVARVRQRCAYLRRLGLGEGKLERVLRCCPEVFTMRQQHLERLVGVLRDKCLFTAQQVAEILYRCPQVLQEGPDELEYKFQYGYFRMGVKHVDVVRTEFLRHPITRIRQRHTFLERLGRYQTPDKKGQTQIPNPLLRSVLGVPEAEFLSRIACSSPEEFEVFKKLLAREEEEKPVCGLVEEQEEEEEQEQQ